MPVEVKGLVELQRALKGYAPDLYKEMKTTWKQTLSGVVKKARAFIPSAAPIGLSRWGKIARKPRTNKHYRHFPIWDSAKAKSGIGYKTSYSKVNYQGFKTAARIQNKDAVGAIFETAGRKNMGGNAGGRKYRSNNPNAGAHFNRALQSNSVMKKVHPTDRKTWGRAIYRAWVEDEGKALAAIQHSIQLANDKFVARVKAGKVQKIK